MYRKLKDVIKKNKILYLVMHSGYKSAIYVLTYFNEIPKKIIYRKQIQKVLKKDEIIVKMDFGGLGDSLKYSTLPELLKKQYNIDFYLHESNKDIFRHNDILELFINNPYFKGFKKSNTPFEFKIFQDDRENIIATYEKHLKLNGVGLPKIYYKPKVIQEYEKIILVDTNQVTGVRFGYEYNNDDVNNIIKSKEYLSGCEVKYVEPKNQDLFTYIDMISSSKYYICFLSGGSVVAAALNKKSSVIIPNNLDSNGRGVFPWLFREASNIEYIHKLEKI